VGHLGRPHRSVKDTASGVAVVLISTTIFREPFDADRYRAAPP